MPDNCFNWTEGTVQDKGWGEGVNDAARPPEDGPAEGAFAGQRQLA